MDSVVNEMMKCIHLHMYFGILFGTCVNIAPLAGVIVTTVICCRSHPCTRVLTIDVIVRK